MKKRIELLSPAGNELSLKAAVQSGADAVYIGGPMFNARRGADNFTIEQIREQADYCHLYGVDLHVAVNTLIRERELDALLSYAYELNAAGADALIIQDLGAASLIKKACPDIALHASTQMTVTSIEGVKYLEQMGFSRVVLARELSKKEIENIVKNTNAEIEVFVHGALCMCYSGQCLMSSIIGGRSANRGCCAQPCRLPYSIAGGGNVSAEAYILSPKDLALINELEELKKIGVSSLKIEGRLKRAEYVSAVTGIYRKYLDCGEKISKADMTELENAFSRSGFTQGYFSGQLGKEMMSHKSPGNSSGNVFSAEAKARARQDVNIRKIPVNIYASLRAGEPLSVTLTDDDYNTVTAMGTIKAETASNVPLDNERICMQLAKLGSTPFKARDVFAELDDGLIIPVREINEVRRSACDMLVAERINRATARQEALYRGHEKKSVPQHVLLTAECETAEQANACAKGGAEVIYIPEEELEKLNDTTARIVIKTADIFDGGSVSGDSVSVASPAAAMHYGDRKLYGTHRLNIYNSRSADLFQKFELVTVSPELNIAQARDVIMHTKTKTELIAYGRLTLMLMKNCPLKAAGKCGGHKNTYKLRDRKNEEFPVLCSSSCIARLINSKPLFMADKTDELLSTGTDALRLIFTIESAEDAKRITTLYKNALNGECTGNIFKTNEFTRGHYYRGVE